MQQNQFKITKGLGKVTKAQRYFLNHLKRLENTVSKLSNRLKKNIYEKEDVQADLQRMKASVQSVNSAVHQVADPMVCTVIVYVKDLYTCVWGCQSLLR